MVQRKKEALDILFYLQACIKSVVTIKSMTMLCGIIPISASDFMTLKKKNN